MATLFNNIAIFFSKYAGRLQQEASTVVSKKVKEDLSGAKQATRKNVVRRLAGLLKNHLLFVLTTLAIAVFGAAMHGDWMMILVFFLKSGDKTPDDGSPDDATTGQDWLSRHHLQGVHWYVLMAIAVSYVSYFALCGFLQWHFYIKRRDKPEEWKCQPDRFLTPEDERHEIILGSLNMIQGGTYSGAIACYIINGGKMPMYFDPLERGLPYLLVSIPLMFLVIDAGAYYMHRLFHEPFLYKNIHKWHHRYKAPTAFSATALHPIEFFIFQSVLVLPIFFIPIYCGVYLPLILYNYYYGMIDHSGIKMDAIWPWQPSSMFHDNHHKYFHVNFGFNLKLWDWMHDTLTRKGRVYSEDIFGGRGKTSSSKKAQ